MTGILREMSPDALVAAIESNTCDGFALWAKALGTGGHDDGDVRWFVSGVPLQFWNGVMRAQFAGGADARIAATLRHFAARQVPLSWLIGPSTRPHDLGRLLEAHGLTFDSESPGMAAQLQHLPTATEQTSGLTITEVGDDVALEQWIETLVAANEFPAFLREQLLQLVGQHGYHRLDAVRYFLGAVKGTPVATSLLFLSAGVAGIYCVATVPSARGRGIGTAMTVTPLLLARDLGYTIGVLQSSQMGLSIYSRLGFQEYCRFSLYFTGV